MHIDDDTLIAYLDGQLPDSEYGPLEQALKDDAALRSRLQALADSSELARRSFEPVLLEPVPPQLIAAIWSAPNPCAKTVTSPGAAKPPGLLAWLSWPGGVSGPRAWPALASVVVLGLGVLIGWQLLGSADNARWALREGGAVSNESLVLALDLSPSGRVLQTSDGAVEVLATFEQVGGGHCREFNRSSPDSTRDQLGVACRAAQGHWRLDFIATEERPAGGDKGTYQTASDEQQERADTFLRKRVQGPPLAAAEEQALIERGWPR